MDHIWAAGETVRSRLDGIEMSLFQEALIKWGVREHPEEEDAMTPSVQFPIMYVAVLGVECLEEINRVSEQLEEVVNVETLEAIEALGRSWDFVSRDATTSGEYTPTGPCYQSPDL